MQVRPVNTNIYYAVTFENRLPFVCIACVIRHIHTSYRRWQELCRVIAYCNEKGPTVRRLTHMHICSPFIISLYATVNHERVGWMGTTPGSLLYVCMYQSIRPRPRHGFGSHCLGIRPYAQLFTRFAYSACATFPALHIVHVWFS